MPLKKVLIKVQQMFPNCQKYKKCCSDDSEFWKGLQQRLDDTPIRDQPFRHLDRNNAPEDFERW